MNLPLLSIAAPLLLIWVKGPILVSKYLNLNSQFMWTWFTRIAQNNFIRAIRFIRTWSSHLCNWGIRKLSYWKRFLLAFLDLLYWFQNFVKTFSNALVSLRLSSCLLAVFFCVLQIHKPIITPIIVLTGILRYVACGIGIIHAMFGYC